MLSARFFCFANTKKNSHNLTAWPVTGGVLHCAFDEQ